MTILHTHFLLVLYHEEWGRQDHPFLMPHAKLLQVWFFSTRLSLRFNWNISWVGLKIDDVWYGLDHDVEELESKEFCFLEKNFKEWYIYLKSFKEWFTSFSMLLSPNVGKYGPEKTPYLDTFQAVVALLSFKYTTETIAFSITEFAWFLFCCKFYWQF